MESPNSLYNNLNGSSGGGGGGSGSNGNGGKESLDSSENIVIPSNFLISTKEIIARFPHNKRVGHYLLGRKLGEGSFAKVKEGLHTVTGQKVAIKVIDKKKAKEDAYVSKNMRREGKLLQMIIHPNIIQLYELMETENSYYLVTELCESGDLMDYICARKYLSEAVTRKFIRQIISAVDYLHRIGILHRDLKIENLLLDKNLNIKLIDFGLSNYTKSELCITQCGSPAYAAPELLAHKKYGAKVDVWSIGVNMYAMLTGNLPFTVEPFNIKSLYNKMMKNEMNPIPEHLSKSGEDLLRKLLNPDPVKRISLKDAMEHPWLNEGYSSVLKPFPYPNKPTDEHLNTTIIRYMNTNMDFNLNEVMENIKANKPSSSLSTYYLLLYKVKSMLLKMDPKKDKLKMQTPTSKPVVQKESIKPAAVNNATTAAATTGNNKPLVVNTVSQQPQVVPNVANSPVARVVKTALINNVSTPVSGNNATSNNVNSSIPAAACSTGGYCPPTTTTNKTVTNRAGQPPDVLNKYVNTKPAERTMSPMSNNSNGANTTNHNSSTTTASSASSSSTNNNTSMTTTGGTLSGAMKNLTQKYKTMHLANSVAAGVGNTTLLDDQLTNRTLSPSLPPPPHIITTNSTPAHHHRIAATATNGPTSNHLYYSTSINTKPNSYNALLNSVDLNHTIMSSSGHQGDLTANNLSSLTAKNSEHKSTSSSSSEEPNSVSHAITPPAGPNHHFVHTMRPIIKTSTLTHRNSLNNGPSSTGSNGGSTTLTHSNSTKLTHADWTTQMIKLNGKARSDLNDTNKLSPNSAVGESNATSAASSNARKSPIVKKIIGNGGGGSGRTASPVTLPAIDAGRAITPQ